MATFIGEAATVASGGVNTLTVPVGTQAGDLIVVHALGRSSNMAVPSGFNALQVGTGSSEGSFTTATVSWKICPSPVPATINAGSASNNSMACMVVYRPDPGETFFFDGQAAANAASGTNITPGNITTTRPATVLIFPASNSSDNTQIVTFGSTATARSNTTTGNRIATSIFETTVGAGTTALPTITLSRTEVRGFFAVAIYTAAVSGAWTYGASTLTVAEAVAAAIDDKVYVLGGTTGGAFGNTLRMYDTTLDTFTTKTGSPINTELSSSACAYGGYFYHHRSAALYRYDPVANSWAVLATPPLTTSRSWIVPDGLGNLWVAGGGASGTTPLMKYDIEAGAWSQPGLVVQNHADKRAALGADGNIYSFGGQIAGVAQTTVEKLDPVAGTVTSSTAMPSARLMGAVGQSKNWIFYAGGWNPSLVISPNLYAFDTETATWSSKTPMLAGVNQAAHAMVGRRFYVIGGYDEGDSFSSAVQIWYDPELNGGALAATGVARSSLYAEGYGTGTGVAITTSGEAEVTFQSGVQADSFLDIGSTGQPPD